MSKTAEYILSSYSFISECSVDQILDVGYQSKEGNPIPSFDENVLVKLCEEARSIFERENNILELEGDFIIVGDIHGSFHDLIRILKYLEMNDSKVLFLGDYVDRGNFSLECITILFALKIIQPNKFYLIRGNHEFDSLCSQYGFKDELKDYHNPKKPKNDTTQPQEKEVFHNYLEFRFGSKSDQEKSDAKIESFQKFECDEFYSSHNDMFCYKYTDKLYEAFVEAFDFLPVCAIINKTNFSIHGGLSPRLQHVEQLSKQIQRPVHMFEDNRLLSDVLWSDPSSSFKTLFGDNPRGRGYFFNSDSVYNFLNVNSLTRLIRGHQCVKHGLRTNFREKCVTVFSASSYSNEFVNECGILRLYQKDDRIEYVTFPPLPRLEKKDALYYKVAPLKESSDADGEAVGDGNGGGDAEHHTCFSFKHPQLMQASANSSRVPHTMSRQIKGYQSVRLSKPLFRTFSKKAVPKITKPHIKHSTSLDDLKGQEAKKEEVKGMTRSNFSLDDLSEFADNM